jgi:hypothetical protein
MFQALFIFMNYDAWNSNLQTMQMSRKAHSSGLYDNPRNTINVAQPIAVLLFANICSTFITAMLIYGCIKGRPIFMMPFLGIQLFEFYHRFSSFMSDLETPVESSKLHDIPSSNYSSMMFTNMINLIYRLYFICVVWKCFKYLRLKELAAMPNTQILVRRTFDVSPTLITSRFVFVQHILIHIIFLELINHRLSRRPHFPPHTSRMKMLYPQITKQRLKLVHRRPIIKRQLRWTWKWNKKIKPKLYRLRYRLSTPL